MDKFPLCEAAGIKTFSKRDELADKWADQIAPVLRTDYHRKKHKESFLAGWNARDAEVDRAATYPENVSQKEENSDTSRRDKHKAVVTSDFNHPCKNTCSGWKAGWDARDAKMVAPQKEVKK